MSFFVDCSQRFLHLSISLITGFVPLSGSTGPVRAGCSVAHSSSLLLSWSHTVKHKLKQVPCTCCSKIIIIIIIIIIIKINSFNTINRLTSEKGKQNKHINVFLNSFPLQEYIFRLEPGKVDSGKGKCPYDPKLNSVSALISKYLLLLFLSLYTKCTSSFKEPAMENNNLSLHLSKETINQHLSW